AVVAPVHVVQAQALREIEVGRRALHADLRKRARDSRATSCLSFRHTGRAPVEGTLRMDQTDLQAPRAPKPADVEPALPGLIEPSYEHVERFAPGAPEGVAYLREHGYVVIRGVLTPAECDAALSLTWDYLEQLGTGIDRNDWTTW